MNIEIANRLLTLRKQFNLSQEDLAARLGISRQAVSRWERAEASPDTDNLIALSKLYNVSIDSLLAMDADGEENFKYQANDNASQIRNEAGISDTRFKGDSDDLMNLLRRLAPVYPVIVTMIYLVLGFALNMWHPGWIVFLTIPIFYVMIRGK